MSDKPLLSPEEVASVLDTGEAAPPQPEVRRGGSGPLAYSLREPVVIPPDAQDEARKRVESLITTMQRVLRRELESELTLALEGFDQRRAATGLETVPEPAWVLSFDHAVGGGLVLVLHPQSALALVELALGGVGNAPESGRGPTPLEERVMNKLAAVLAPVLGEAIGEPLTSGRLAIGSVPESFASPGEIVGAALIKVEIGSGTQNSALLVSTELLSDEARDTNDRETLQSGPLATPLTRVRVEARPVLKAGNVSLADLLGLESGVTLRFDADESALWEMRVEKTKVLAGRIARGTDGPTFTVAWRRGRPAAQEAKE